MLVGEDQRPWSLKELIPQEIGALALWKVQRKQKEERLPQLLHVVTKTLLQVEPLWPK